MHPISKHVQPSDLKNKAYLQLISTQNEYIFTTAVLVVVQPVQVAPHSISGALEPGTLVLKTGGLGG